VKDGRSAFGLFALFASALFLWHAVHGLRTGEARIPIQILGADLYERGDTMFGLAIFMNFLGAIAGAVVAICFWSGVF
jgi:hypothetical protein